MHRVQAHLTYANVVSSICLFLLVAGGAAWAIGKNSVGTKQLKANAVKNSKLAKDAVTAPKVKDGSLLLDDFAPGQVPQGAEGPVGPAGRSALTVLQSGETVRGAIGARDNMGATTESFVALASLPIPAPVPITDAAVEVKQGADNSGACTGTASAPTAPPGLACIYRSAGSPNSSNNTNTRGLGLANGASPYGFRVAIDPTVANDVVLFEGTWAYTAP